MVEAGAISADNSDSPQKVRTKISFVVLLLTSAMQRLDYHEPHELTQESTLPSTSSP